MSTLNFAKVVPEQTLNFTKDFGEAIKGTLSFNLNWSKINGRSVDLDAILVTKSSGRAYDAQPAVVPTVTVKKAGFFSKMFGGQDKEISEGGSEATPAGISKAGVHQTLAFDTRKDSVKYFDYVDEKGRPVPAIQGALHYGDDLTGASAEGEFIEVNLDGLPPEIDELVFSVISHSGQSFSELPFASIEAFTGKPSNPGRGLVSMELTSFNPDTKLAILAVVKKNAAGEWEVTGKKIEGTRGSVSAATRLSANL